ncbi:hypothetical protein KFU94_04835 [Chloroflexi bacterium TSY]|nr:hypothetical protein [Chloroflexi bacterium TSY]
MVHFVHHPIRLYIQRAMVFCLAFGLFGLLLWLVHIETIAAEFVDNQDAARQDLIRQRETSLTLLQNDSFECTEGYTPQMDAGGQEIFVPNNWTLVPISGTPIIHSTQLFFENSCDGNNFRERIDGIDSIVIRAQDIETNPAPGKPFDTAFYQQVNVMTGTAYSVSGWMLSLCGGSTVPSDCPDGYYINKMLGIDPTGGVDPLADHVVWAGNRDNFVDANNQRIGWVNLRTVAKAQNNKITVFARIRSPFQHHGNHAFIDYVSLVQAPTAELVLPKSDPLTGTLLIPEVVAVRGSQAEVRWAGQLGSDIPQVKGSSHQLVYDIQTRQGSDEWQDFVDSFVGVGCQVFSASPSDQTHELRIRARALQLNEKGESFGHRFPGPWSKPVSVLFQALPLAPLNPNPVYLPILIGVDHLTCIE